MAYVEVYLAGYDTGDGRDATCLVVGGESSLPENHGRERIVSHTPLMVSGSVSRIRNKYGFLEVRTCSIGPSVPMCPKCKERKCKSSVNFW